MASRAAGWFRLVSLLAVEEVKEEEDGVGWLPVWPFPWPKLAKEPWELPLLCRVCEEEGLLPPPCVAELLMPETEINTIEELILIKRTDFSESL